MSHADHLQAVKLSIGHASQDVLAKFAKKYAAHGIPQMKDYELTTGPYPSIVNTVTSF